MATSSRKQIEGWLRTLDIKGSVIDVGGVFWPVKGRTKSWNVDTYHIFDTCDERNGVSATFVGDINEPISLSGQYDNTFFIEVTDHLFNPFQAFKNLANLTKRGGKVFLSSNFIYPHHTGIDMMRFTLRGLKTQLTFAGFGIVSISPRFAASEALPSALDMESPIQYRRGEVGYMIVAEKL